MKCYFTLTDGIINDEKNMNMLKLSLKTAKENTSLSLYALYDGSEGDAVYKIFKEYGVNVIICKCTFEDKIEKYYKNWEFDGTLLNSLKRMLGCFMKFDIAQYEKEDEVVLYSDIDTIFNKDFDWQKFNNVKTLAAAPEFRKEYDYIKGYKYFSAGIMVLNISELKRRREILFNMLENNIKPYQECLDQGFWNELYKNDFEEMPLEFNWKPYWGINDDAVIVHVHGWKMGHELTEDSFDFCCHIVGITPKSIEGIIYYTVMGYRILGLNKDKEIANLTEYLTAAKLYREKEQTVKRMFKFNAYIMFKVYKKTKKYLKYSFFRNLNSYAEKYLKKRNILGNKQEYAELIKEN